MLSEIEALSFHKPSTSLRMTSFKVKTLINLHNLYGLKNLHKTYGNSLYKLAFRNHQNCWR